MSGGAPAGRAYLPEVDGLRALAVVAVVLYHLDPAWVPGGYVGVDVFFVISGFLITRIITDEHTRGEFGFASFYLRRIRRIAPAALAMVLATLFAGSLLLLPEDLERLAASALWTVFQAANVFFWLHLDTGYFAASSKEEPLLHAWSLGVEEQFYLLWPVLLALLLSSRLRGRALLALLGLAAAASFWLAQASLETAPKFAYYMLPARAGELLTGAGLALALRRTGMRVLPARLADVIGAAGLAAVLWAMAALSPTSAFPGLRALPPVLGSAALILAACAGSPLVRMVFAWRPMVWIGLLSYSLYLWHWPVLAYARYFFGEQPGGPVLAVAVVVFALLAWASYRWIETPARHWDASGACQVGWLLIVPAVTVALLAIGVRMPGGVAERIADSEVFLRSRAELERRVRPASDFREVCQLSMHARRILDRPRCVFRPDAAGGEPRVLLWGDSHAAHYFGVIAEIAGHTGLSFRNAEHAACPPVFGGDYGRAQFHAGCRRFRPTIRRGIAEGRFDAVIIGASWDSYDALPGFREHLRETIEELGQRDIKVVLLAQVPRFRAYHRECELRALRMPLADCVTRARLSGWSSRANRHLQRLAREYPHVDYLAVDPYLCSGGGCSPYGPEGPLYFDSGHLSMAGSRALGRYILATDPSGPWTTILSPGHLLREQTSQGRPASQSSSLPSPMPSNRKVLR